MDEKPKAEGYQTRAEFERQHPVASGAASRGTAAPGAKEAASEAVCPHCGKSDAAHGFEPFPSGDSERNGVRGDLICPALDAGNVAPDVCSVCGREDCFWATHPQDPTADRANCKYLAEGIPADILATSGVLDLQELRNAGYLQEVNRIFFHPLGLALAVQPDATRDRLFVLDRRSDLEGFVFSDEAGLREKADLVEAQRHLRRIPRMEKLGYFVQPPFEAREAGCTCPERCPLHNWQEPPAPGQLRGKSPISAALDAMREVEKMAEKASYKPPVLTELSREEGEAAFGGPKPGHAPAHSTLLEMIGLADDNRCMACAGPVVHTFGLPHADCVMVFSERHPEYFKWKQRTQILALARKIRTGELGKVNLPSAQDLDAVAEEKKVADATAGER